MNALNPDIFGSTGGSCIVAYTGTNRVQIERDSCIGQNYFFCEKEPNSVIPVGLKKDFQTMLQDGPIEGFYSHTTNSISSCSLYCGQTSAVTKGSECACIDNIGNNIKVLEVCEHLVPCPGNLLQPCGCKIENDDKIYPIAMMTQSSVMKSFTSCLILQKQGILMDGTFINNAGESIKCELWSRYIILKRLLQLTNCILEGICEEDWHFYGEYCIQIQTTNIQASSVKLTNKPCTHGSLYFDTFIGFWIEVSRQNFHGTILD